MRTSPRASIVTTVYNGEPYFGQAIPSILQQTYQDFEWIIVDDGSTDRTPELLRRLAEDDKRVRVQSPGRLGRARALNYAIDRASGSYIIQQDFDDVSYPERIRLQVELMDAHPEVGLVGAYYVVQAPHRGEHYIRKPPTSHDEIVRSMARYIPFAHTLVTFRKNGWQQVGGYPELDDIEDLALWVNFVKIGWKLANIPEVLGEHWIHAQSYWHRHFTYAIRQRKLAAVQWKAIRTLDLPIWMGIYPAGRYVYARLPHLVRRIVRRTLGGSAETDLASGSGRFP